MPLPADIRGLLQPDSSMSVAHLLPRPPLQASSSSQPGLHQPMRSQVLCGRGKRQYSKRGVISKIACQGCRTRKTKCDSRRPTCRSCEARSVYCAYDSMESERSTIAMRNQIRSLTDERDTLSSVLLCLQSDAEDAATEVFRRLRTGESMNSLAQEVFAARALASVEKQRSPGDVSNGS